ncbi:MAG: (2Fe-2S) ferredoxin domain-containing protein [Oscillospiraceae bacterium]
MKIVVGQGSCGIAAGALKVLNAFKLSLENRNDIKLTIAGCIGMCFLEPIVDVYLDDNSLKRFVRVKETDVERIITAINESDFNSVNDLLIKRKTRIFYQSKQELPLLIVER